MTRLASPPPGLLDAEGAPRFGAWGGRLETVDWAGLKLPRRPGWFDRRFRHKRWQFVGLTHPDCFIGVAVVELGWAAHGFLYAFERHSARLHHQSGEGLPGRAHISSTPFSNASLRLGKLAISMFREGTALRISARGSAVRLEAELDLGSMSPPACVVAPGGFLAHCTHKSGAIQAAAVLRIGERTLRLQRCNASIDHSDGFLPHETAWRWVSAHSRGLGFNLQTGFMENAENIVWLGGVPHSLGAVRFLFRPENPLAPWKIRSECGALELDFLPEGHCSGKRDFGLVASRYSQIFGRFTGKLAVPGRSGVGIADMAGLAEDHASRW